ncbi:anti-sigma regulatory factor (Ser/Thr protein kinase) [Mycolicibacterium rhodesiae NBB3]|jgi:anti-sigma regulatory factor (Ser/Thr protein kinase)|uniref:Anti-sigma regulatory factor (Ser/Thr protein kinase) n=1 Tax=Mycolicibacterium rhodesiae (strain NBB3) TaxID=710685 RepID=G8RS47_MYCRN|nr:ATP-binding protein [Mycolicibacterium rhodesiae]AEV74004.1 anti-sigma regulatory factor (Ser/Thr protein kinase) [Mycolicibacterium rhodesiae NBB3]
MSDPILSTTATDADFVYVDTADARTVARLRRELARWLETQVTLDAEKLNDILLAVNEALTNVAEFAYRGRQGMMGLQVRCDRADGTLIVDVTDRGTWRHVDPASQPNTRGRGIPLMRALSDRTTIARTPHGTHVQMEFADCAHVRAEELASA